MAAFFKNNPLRFRQGTWCKISSCTCHLSLTHNGTKYSRHKQRSFNISLPVTNETRISLHFKIIMTIISTFQPERLLTSLINNSRSLKLWKFHPWHPCSCLPVSINTNKFYIISDATPSFYKVYIQITSTVNWKRQVYRSKSLTKSSRAKVTQWI